MITDALNKTGSYSEYDFDLFEKEYRIRDIGPGDMILNIGEVAKSAYYVLSGAVYQYRLDDEIEEIILDLAPAGKWVLDQKSFVAQKPSENCIKAYETSQLLEISLDSIHKLIGLSASFFQLGRLLDATGHRALFFDRSLSPLEKYQTLLDDSPQILQKFPLKMIASYLRITPETISRVRKKIVANKNPS
ncbi:Crp/Fnr family transcriptional regulator [Pedobacter frigidisoli]|uniref:Crp/Fnr family transcriptional regulator n=1 Tax=Pedobacter frigidisoli TaxID=2530455 RepID=UPI00292FCE92|nr:Crp/Fnr family transcriptional regulator [Pedobacter frigidisoli]